MSRVLFFGTPSFAATILDALIRNRPGLVRAVITQPDKPAGRGSLVVAPPVKEVATAASIPVFQPRSVRKELEALTVQLGAIGGFDLGIVVAFGQILPKGILDFPTHGCVNIHASLLPRWRGAAPMQRSIIAGDRETGICLMRMDEGLDTGPVYSKRALTIAPRETFGSLHDRMVELAVPHLLEDLDAILSGSIPPEAQPEEGVTYAQKITAAEAALDFDRPAIEVDRLVRGLSPAPGAFTMLVGKRLKIFDAEAVAQPDTGPVGTLVVTHEGAMVRCASGSLRLREVQLEGKKRMPAEVFFRGFPVEPGTVLGRG